MRPKLARLVRPANALQFHLFSKPWEHCVTSCILRSAYSGSTPPEFRLSLRDTRRLNSAQSRLRQLYLLLLIVAVIILAHVTLSKCIYIYITRTSRNIFSVIRAYHTSVCSRMREKKNVYVRQTRSCVALFLSEMMLKLQSLCEARIKVGTERSHLEIQWAINKRDGRLQENA